MLVLITRIVLWGVFFLKELEVPRQIHPVLTDLMVPGLPLLHGCSRMLIWTGAMLQLPGSRSAKAEYKGSLKTYGVSSYLSRASGG